MIGFTKLLTGKATVAATIHAAECGAVPPHLLQFSTVSRPIVVWNLTGRCNLRCRHCYLEAGSGEQMQELTTNEGRNLIRELGEMKIPVLLFSGGEPLLRPDLWELAEYARSQGLRIVLSTNGTLITPAVAERIKDCGFAYVGVSIDGGQKVHDAFRGIEGSFEKALDGLRNVQKVGLKTGIRFTVNKNNYQDLPLVLDLIKSEGVPRFCLYHLVYAGRGKDMAAQDITIDDKREMVEYLIKKVNSFNREGVSVEILTTDHHADGIYLYRWIKENIPEREQDVRRLLEMHGGCSAGVKTVNIDPAGNVFPCQFWRSSSLGKYPERSFREIWYDEDNALLKALRDKVTHLKGKCGDCKYNTLCGGCRIRAEAVKGDIWAEDPVCYLTDEEISG
jgi:radical SAM protein with 4Fe4S-binding SPASM domain